MSPNCSDLVTRNELYCALWIQGAPIIGAQLAIAGLTVTLLP